MATEVIRDRVDGPATTVPLSQLDDEQLRYWASLGSADAVEVLAGRPRPLSGWAARTAQRMGPGRGQA
jgi:hypothetical protein